MDKQMLEQMVNDGHSQHQLAKKLAVSQSTIRYWLNKFSLKTKHEPFCKKELACECGETNPDKFYESKDGYKRGTCKRCFARYAVARFRRYKKQAVEYKGGKCSECGYDKCLGSLDFHHPNQKDPKWERMRNWRFEKIKSELDKCILLCKNCHGELHWGI